MISRALQQAGSYGKVLVKELMGGKYKVFTRSAELNNRAGSRYTMTVITDEIGNAITGSVKVLEREGRATNKLRQEFHSGRSSVFNQTFSGERGNKGLKYIDSGEGWRKPINTNPQGAYPMDVLEDFIGEFEIAGVKGLKSNLPSEKELSQYVKNMTNPFNIAEWTRKDYRNHFIHCVAQNYPNKAKEFTPYYRIGYDTLVLNGKKLT